MIKTKYVTYRSKQIPVENLKPNSGIKFEVQCDECGKIFVTCKYQLTQNGHELCQACALRINNEKILEVGSKFNRLTVLGRSSTGRSKCQCECGNIVIVDNCALKRGTTKSCGCYQKDVARQNIAKAVKYGEEHHSWKGGITTLRQKYDGSKQKTEFCHRLIQDIGHCIICKGTEKLEVHHLFAFQLRPDLAFDESNTAVLCQRCHKKFHSAYGLKTTPNMFREYQRRPTPDVKPC